MSKSGRFPILLLVILLACGAALWLLIANLPGEYSKQVSILQSANASDEPDYPETPEQWQGKVDYAGLDARILRMMDDPTMAGLAVAIVEDGRLSFVQGYGVTNRNTGERVTSDTVFRWASVSKSVASTLTVDLVSDGKLSWQAPIASYGTTLRLPDRAEHYLGLDAILSHRLGLPKNAYDGWLEGGTSPKVIRASMASVNKQCEPGDCHSYQNVAYDTLSEVVENATGHSYAREVQTRLFEPLGMTGASLDRDGLVGADSWARPYQGERMLEVVPNYYRVPAAAGVNSNIVDLAKWMQAQMGAAPATLSENELQTLHKPRIGTNRVYGRSDMGRALKSPSYGFGWRSFVYEGHELVGHSGAVNGYRASVMFDPETRTGIVLLWNSGSGRPFRLQLEMFDMYYGREGQNWLELKADLPFVEEAVEALETTQAD